jgi:riboflavin synthase
MFTGLIQEIGTMSSMSTRGNVRIITIAAELAADLSIGESIAVDGVCQTVTSSTSQSFSVEATGETLKRTTLQVWTGQRSVNLERSLRLGDRLDGHIVLGHVDGMARLLRKRQESNGLWYDLQSPDEVSRFLASQGSVALDGVSLTIAQFRAPVLSVSVIPTTLQLTTLGNRRPGDYLNLEVDILARYVERLHARDRSRESRRRDMHDWI